VSAEEIDNYLAAIEESKRSTLQALRRTIREIVPEAEEVISYRVPAFRLGGQTIAGFAAYKNHLPFSGFALRTEGSPLKPAAGATTPCAPVARQSRSVPAGISGTLRAGDGPRLRVTKRFCAWLSRFWGQPSASAKPGTPSDFLGAFCLVRAWEDVTGRGVYRDCTPAALWGVVSRWRCECEEEGVTADKSGRTSAGILLWRSREGRVEVLLAHQGGPFWVTKDVGHWTIPKGEVEPGEELVAVARREFAEETGHRVPDGPLIELGQITQKSGKLVLGWAVEGDLDPAMAVSNTYELEWPPHSGVVQTFPEIDRVEWFGLDEGRRRLKAAQTPFLDRLQATLLALGDADR
jgi:predicted NUDIX family NTP pyrophosphohydrolase